MFSIILKVKIIRINISFVNHLKYIIIYILNRCPGLAFRCDYGACISKNLKCDGKNDCFDGSDENAFVCRANSEIANSSTYQSNQSACT